MIKRDSHAEKNSLAFAKSDSKRIALYFLFAYFAQGISCAQFGVIAQPIQFFMMEGMHLDSAQISSSMSLMMVPWMVKPFYGLISDFIPLFGYRRKSYLVLVNSVSAIAFFVMLISRSLFVVLACLMCTALAMAIATALMVGFAVEKGQDGADVRRLFVIQEIAYYSANVFAVILGGSLCQKLDPLNALHTAALIAIVPLLLISILTVRLVQENKSKLDLAAVGNTMKTLNDALRSPALWLVATFSFLWSFLPCFGVPLYFYESKTLAFSQSSIGQLAGWNSLGMLLASFAYPLLLRFFKIRAQLDATSVLVLLSTISFSCIASPQSAAILELFHGFANLTAILSVYGLASDVCPRRIEVSVMAWLVAVRNIATSAATFAGGQLFSNVLHGDFRTLVFFAGLAPVISLLLVPLACRVRAEEIARQSEVIL